MCPTGIPDSLGRSRLTPQQEPRPLSQPWLRTLALFQRANSGLRKGDLPILRISPLGETLLPSRPSEPHNKFGSSSSAFASSSNNPSVQISLFDQREMSLTVGVLALQGSFAEHVTSLRLLPDPNLTVVEVKTPASLAKCDGLIIPGGESTTMALVARRWGLIEPLREFAGKGRPVWGTCAGMIFLANAAVAGTKEGGQELIGGLDIGVSRNFFGAQINSFETRLPAPPSLQSVQRGVPRDNIKETFRAIFIRAPAVMHVGKDVEVLGEYKLTDEERAEDASRPEKVVVAVRQGSLLATAFHPEATDDRRWHALFVDMVSASAAKLGKAVESADAKQLAETDAHLVAPKDVPKPLPVITTPQSPFMR